MSVAAHAVSCGVVLANGRGEIFVCHTTGAGRWDLPKGLADDGEAPRDAAVREAWEEAGLLLPADRLAAKLHRAPEQPGFGSARAGHGMEDSRTHHFVLVPALGASAPSSTSVFHSPQASHLPDQRAEAAPQFWQMKLGPRAAMVFASGSAIDEMRSRAKTRENFFLYHFGRDFQLQIPRGRR